MSKKENLLAGCEADAGLGWYLPLFAGLCCASARAILTLEPFRPGSRVRRSVSPMVSFSSAWRNVGELKMRAKGMVRSEVRML